MTYDDIGLPRPQGDKDKKRKTIDQLKYAKQASRVEQPCDTGNLHTRERHHAKHVSKSDMPTIHLLNPLAEQLQEFRDTG